ncbi:hypothetical protein NDU88_010279 [Pleurodeles waltl]|uniref:Uncharacterized protein n=1 Tax=Pleurodeles waltl TaxID=8319 RepID=A0AAV7S2V3_PLEWA|nr:hypothetical protein NDU88_010279 [Pleurodeles waltl]
MPCSVASRLQQLFSLPSRAVIAGRPIHVLVTPHRGNTSVGVRLCLMPPFLSSNWISTGPPAKISHCPRLDFWRRPSLTLRSDLASVAQFWVRPLGTQLHRRVMRSTSCFLRVCSGACSRLSVWRHGRAREYDVPWDPRRIITLPGKTGNVVSLGERCLSEMQLPKLKSA